MSEPKWTNGPWSHVVKFADHTAIGAKTLIARVYSETFRDTANEEANARLIAAAPDLYQALKWLYAAIEKQALARDFWHEGSEELEIMSDARAALAKARGEQPHA